jgi:hypothetical protein
MAFSNTSGRISIFCTAGVSNTPSPPPQKTGKSGKSGNMSKYGHFLTRPSAPSRHGSGVYRGSRVHCFPFASRFAQFRPPWVWLRRWACPMRQDFSSRVGQRLSKRNGPSDVRQPIGWNARRPKNGMRPIHPIHEKIEVFSHPAVPCFCCAAPRFIKFEFRTPFHIPGI